MNYGYPLRNGLGCNCQTPMPLMGFGAVSDFDLITIGGKQYSAGELQAKSPTIIAQKDTTVYSSAFDNSVAKYVTKAGNPLGKYYSYLKPGVNRKASWLMLETGPGKYVYLPNETVGSNSIANQNVQTAQEQIAQEAADKEKESDPYSYYFKKLVLPVLGTGALIYVAVQLGKTFITAKVAKG